MPPKRSLEGFPTFQLPTPRKPYNPSDFPGFPAFVNPNPRPMLPHFVEAQQRMLERKLSSEPHKFLDVPSPPVGAIRPIAIRRGPHHGTVISPVMNPISNPMVPSSTTAFKVGKGKSKKNVTRNNYHSLSSFPPSTIMPSAAFNVLYQHP